MHYSETDQPGLLTAQHHVITYAQALASGLSGSAVQRRLRAGGRWQRLLPGVYLTVTGTPTRDQLDVAALLYAGPASALTGLAALRRNGIRAPRTEAVDVLVPAKLKRQSAEFVVVHRTWRSPERVCYEGQIQWVLPARAVADAVRGMSDLLQVRGIVAAAVQDKACTIGQLEAELRSGPVRGSGLFRAALAEVGQGVRSVPETDLMVLIKRGRLPMPLFNPALYAGSELIARPDVWWPKAGVAVEVDSKQWHLSPQGWEQTMARHARMTALGILVLHFSPRQIRDEPEVVLRTIRSALLSRRDQPAPRVRTVLAAG
jgi:hypothetical protein